VNAAIRSSHPLRRTRLALVVVGLALGACQALPRVPASVLFDPQGTPAEQTYFRQSFEERPSSIQLGPGWFAEEKDWGEDHHGVGWTTKLSRIYFGVPEVQPAEVVALVTPLVYSGALVQTLTPVLNGHKLPTVSLAAGWSEIRIALPPEDLAAPINILDLFFDHDAVPAKVGMGPDTRTLAAAFNLIAVLPRGEALREKRSEVRGPGVERQLVLRRQPIAVSLPPATRYEVRLGAVRGAGQRLAIDFDDTAGPRRRLWEGPAAEAAWRRFTFTAATPRTARLLLSRGVAGPATELAIEMSPPEVYAQPDRGHHGGPPDVFLYLIDTLRADAVGVYGAHRPTSPAIDRFSRDAVVFAAARSAASWTLPATTSILSGLYPSRHGVTVPGARVPRGFLPWLPTLLAGRGYETVGISQWLLGGDAFGLNHGFSSFYVNVRQNAKTRSASARWFLWRHLLARPPQAKPLFCYLHVVDPHARYLPGRRDRAFADEHPGTLQAGLYDPHSFLDLGLGKNPADVAHLRALYDGEVLAADRQFGRFVLELKFFDLYDESLVILVGDHGEEFADHGGFDHGRTLYEELLRVPLIVKFPRSWKLSGRVETAVSTVDLAPTILEAAGGIGGEGGQGFQGASLTATARNESGEHGAVTGARPLFSETRIDALDLKAALLGTVKCIANATGVDRNARPAPAFEAFDLAHDPRERSPLSPTDRGVELCKRELQSFIAHPGASFLERRPLAPEDEAKLRSLGYLR
jgi:arylsulfatase A-like enzyme